MKVFVVVLALVMLAALAQAKVKTPCSNLVSPANPKQKFDLSYLVGKSFTATANNFGTNIPFTWAICGNVPCNRDPSASVCQTTPFNDEIVVGQWNPNAIKVLDATAPLNGIGLEYTNLEGRVSHVFVICDKTAKTPTNFQATYPSDSAQPTILTLNHTSGCPAKKGLSAGWVLFILLIVGVVLYFILGFIWNRFKLGKEGTEAIPNFLWAELPGLCADGFRFIVAKIRGTPTSYETVA